jgi:hypothetical protein
MQRLTANTLDARPSLFSSNVAVVCRIFIVVADDLALACQASMIEANVDH